MTHWAPFLLVGVTAVLLILPVMPALHELRQRHDANPLPTSRHDGRITNFSDSLQSRLETCREDEERAFSAVPKVTETQLSRTELLCMAASRVAEQLMWAQIRS